MLLGDDHDLTLLRETLIREAWQIGDTGDMELRLVLIEHRQVQLRRQATSLAQRFFEVRPADFARSLKGFWRTWREQSKLKQTGEPQAALV
jgi:hypothetical protein